MRHSASRLAANLLEAYACLAKHPSNEQGRHIMRFQSGSYTHRGTDVSCTSVFASVHVSWRRRRNLYDTVDFIRHEIGHDAHLEALRDQLVRRAMQR